jgi:uncharacterized protein DUF4339
MELCREGVDTGQQGFGTLVFLPSPIRKPRANTLAQSPRACLRLCSLLGAGVAGNWYYADTRGRVGPIDLAELKARLATCANVREVLVWRPGLSDWTRAGDLPELADAVPAASPIADAARDPTVGADEGKASPPTHRFNNFIARNWRGEFSLGVSYWVFGVLTNLAIIVAILVVGGILLAHPDYQPALLLGLYVVIWFGATFLVIWQTVGVWRSANRRILERSRAGQGAFWSYAAKIAISFGVLRFVLDFLTSGVPQLSDAWSIALLDDPSFPRYSVRVMRDGTEIELSGGIKYGLAAEFDRALAASPRIRVVHLDSLGGRIGEAEKLYEIIRDHQLVTYVSARCYSACTVAFAGGRERWMHRNATLGFHAPALAGMPNQNVGGAVRRQKKLLKEAGFDPAFVERALDTPHSEIWRPSASELLRARVVTALSDGSQFAMSGYGPDVTHDIVAEHLARGAPLFTTLKRRFPAHHAALIDMFYQGYASGRAEAETMAEMRDKFQSVIATYRPLADDSVLLDFSRLAADVYAALGKQNPTWCYLHASGEPGPDDYLSNIPAALIERENVLNERILATAAVRPPVNESQVAPIYEKVVAQLSQRFGPEKAELISKDNVPAARHADYCAVITAMFQIVAALPGQDGVSLLRFTYRTK